MVNNLEELIYHEVVNSKGETYTEFRKKLIPVYQKVLLNIMTGYIFLAAVVTITIYFQNRFPGWNILSVPVGASCTGYIIAYLISFVHEAGHYNLHPDKKLNDLLASIFLCSWIGLSIKSYRKIHWQHHLFLGSTNDTETSYFHPLNKAFFWEILTGIHLFRTIIKKEGSEILTQPQKKAAKKMLLTGFLIHSIIITATLLTGHWAFTLTWILAFGLFFPLFATLRQILEHRDELAKSSVNYYNKPHGKISRLFFTNLLSSSFGAAGFTRHMLHHWDPHISYTRLKEVEEFLFDSEKTKPIINHSKTSYSIVFNKLLASE